MTLHQGIADILFERSWPVRNPGAPAAMEIDGTHAFVGLESKGLIVLDLQNPQQPTLIGELNSDFPVLDLVISEDVAYCAAGEAGLVFIDISDPTTPAQIGSLSLDARVTRVVLNGETAYLSSPEAGLFAVNISDLSNPELLDQVVHLKFTGLAVSGNRVYAAGDPFGTFVYQIEPAGDLLHVETLDAASEVVVQDGFAYLTPELWLLQIDLSTGVRRFIQTGFAQPPGRLKIKDGEIVYRDSIVSIADPTSPHLVATLLGGAAYFQTERVNDFYVGIAETGKLTTFVDHSPHGDFLTTIDVANLEVVGDDLWVAGYEKGLWNFSLTKGTNGGTKHFSEPVSEIERLGVAKVVQSFRSLQVLNETNLFYQSQDFDHSGNYLFGAPNDLGVFFYAKSNQLLGLTTNHVPGFLLGLDVTKDNVYAAGGPNDLMSYSRQLPGWPVLTASVKTKGRCQAVCAAPPFVFVAEGQSGVGVYDVSDPFTPLFLYQIETGGEAMDVEAVGSQLYVAAGPVGIKIYDFSPTAATLVDQWPGATINELILHGEKVIAGTPDSVKVFTHAFLQQLPPTILEFEEDYILEIGRSHHLEVRVAGQEPLAYQWFFEGSPLTGQTNRFFTITNATLEAAGAYTVTVSNIFGVVSSDTAKMRFAGAPEILTIPEFRSVFHSWVGEDPVMYAWKRNGVTLSNNKTYSLPQIITWTNLGAYTLELQNEKGKARSLRRYPLKSSQLFPGISAMLHDWNDAGEVYLLVTPLPSPSVPTPIASVQVDWGDGTIVQNTGQPLVHRYANTQDRYVVKIHAVLQDGHGVDFWGLVTFQETPGPVILDGLEDRTLFSGQELALEAIATGFGRLQYQWRFNGADLPGKTATNLVLTNISQVHAGTYELVVKDSEGRSTQAEAQVQVLGQTIYNHQLKTSPGPEWSGGHFALGKFSFPLAKRTGTLTLTNLPVGDQVVVSVTLGIENTWDGINSRKGPDIWEVFLGNGRPLFKTTFSNRDRPLEPEWQNFPEEVLQGKFAARTGAYRVHLPGNGTGLTEYLLSFIFEPAASTEQITFRSNPVAASNDESWWLKDLSVNRLESQSNFVQFSQPVYSAFPGATTIELTAERLGDLEAPLEVPLLFQNGSATVGIDFDAVDAAFQFAPGQQTATVQVPVYLFPDVATNRTAFVELGDSPLSAPLFIRRKAALHFVYEPGLFQFTAGTYSVWEGAGFDPGLPVQPVSAEESFMEVELQAVEITAQAPRDFGVPATVRLFPAQGNEAQGQVRVQIHDNSEDNPDREFSVRFIDPIIGYNPVGNASTRVIILDNDSETTPGISFNGALLGSLQASDGSILVGGLFTQVSGRPVGSIVRLDPQGQVDFSFAPSLDFSVEQIFEREDGSFIAAESNMAFEGGAIARILADGSVETNYSPLLNGEIYSLLPISGDRLLVVANFQQITGQPGVRLGMLLPDGTLDAGFNPAMDFQGPLLLASRDENSVFLAGYSASPNTEYKLQAMRLDGTADPSFTPMPIQGLISDISKGPSGSFLIGGNFTDLAGIPSSNLALISPAGEVLQTFPPSPLVTPRMVRFSPFGGYLANDANWHSFAGDGSYSGLATNIPGRDFYVQNDGTLLVFGEVSTVNGTISPSFARVDREGNLLSWPGYSPVPAVTVENPRVVAVAGSRFDIPAVVAEGADVYWTRQGNPILDGNQETLVFDPLELSDSGEYTINARTDHYWTTKTVDLFVVPEDALPHFSFTSDPIPQIQYTAGVGYTVDLEYSNDLQTWHQLERKLIIVETNHISPEFLETTPPPIFIRAVFR